MKWLRKFWMSPAEHEQIVEELQSKIDRLEEDYVTVSQSLIGEIQARRGAERVRDFLEATMVRRPPLAKGNVIPFDRGNSKISPILVDALGETQV